MLKLESAGKLPGTGENWQLVAHDPVEIEKVLVEVGNCSQITWDQRENRQLVYGQNLNSTKKLKPETLLKHIIFLNLFL